jgi:hypothetical protein
MIRNSSRREALRELEKEVSRRAFISKFIKGAGAVAVFDRFGEKLFADEQSKQNDKQAVFLPTPYAVFSAIGNLVIPVDQDPGWATFEPDITQYGLNVMAGQVFLGGNGLAFQGLQSTLSAMNEIPVAINYSPTPFLEMGEPEQARYYTDILTGQFENDGVQDILNFAALFGLVSTKATFFSNFPRHLAQPGAEFQVLPPSPVKTGWDIMRFKGPVGPEEEKQLRDKYFNAEELPGVDLRNPYI